MALKYTIFTILQLLSAWKNVHDVLLNEENTKHYVWCVTNYGKQWFSTPTHLCVKLYIHTPHIDENGQNNTHENGHCSHIWVIDYESFLVSFLDSSDFLNLQR